MHSASAAARTYVAFGAIQVVSLYLYPFLPLFIARRDQTPTTDRTSDKLESFTLENHALYQSKALPVNKC